MDFTIAERTADEMRKSNPKSLPSLPPLLRRCRWRVATVKQGSQAFAELCLAALDLSNLARTGAGPSKQPAWLQLSGGAGPQILNRQLLRANPRG